MRVGLAVLAGAVATAIGGFGVFAAQFDYALRADLALNGPATEDYRAFVGLEGGHRDANGETLCSQASPPCTDVDGLMALVATLDASATDWQVLVLVRRSHFAAGADASGISGPEVPTSGPAGITILMRPIDLPLQAGEAPTGPADIVLSDALADALGVGVGDQVSLAPRKEGNQRPGDTFTVTGVLRDPTWVVPFTTGRATWDLGWPLAIASPDALPMLADDEVVLGVAAAAWTGDVSAIGPGVAAEDVEPGLPRPSLPSYLGNLWLAIAALCALVASLAWAATLRRSRGSRVRRAAWLLMPGLAGIVLVTVASVAQTAVVLAMQPAYLMRPPWPPLPWTLTALLASITITCVGGALSERRNRALQHHQVVDVDELPGVGLP